MIDVKLLEKGDDGRYVTYVDSMRDKKLGRIKSWNDKWIFVVYNCADCWDDFRDYTAAATDPKDLTWN